jgi:hypothetical protein
LATAFHLPPVDASAVELDELIVLHGKVSEMTEERNRGR